MKNRITRICIGCALSLALCPALALGAAESKAKPSPTPKATAKGQDAKKTEAAKQDTIGDLKNQLADLPKSSFTPAESSGKGRNPFLAKAEPQLASVDKKSLSETETRVFLLNGITGPPIRSAMINGRTFLQGEEGEVRLPSGTKVLIRCAEIGNESAVIEVSGIRKELHLRAGI